MEVKPSTRTFSKRMLVFNILLAWGAIFYAIFTSQAAAVVASGFGLVLSLYGLYTGIGHLDMRSLVSAVAKSGDGDQSFMNNDWRPTIGETPQPPSG